MARPRKFADDATRQAAHRARRKSEVVEVDRAAFEAQQRRLERLQSAVHAAAKAGDAIAQEGRAGSVETLIEKLAAAFERRAEGSK
jgi:hypothetical protein